MQHQRPDLSLEAWLWHKPATPAPEPAPDSTAELQPPPLDVIRTEYHPRSNLPPRVVKFEDYREYNGRHRRPTPRNPAKPWTPFRTRAEFEFAEIALDAALNNRQVDALLRVFRRCLEGEDSLDFKDHNELQKMWDLASVLHTRVCSSICNNCNSYLHRAVNYVG
jgi:hypothetical protein